MRPTLFTTFAILLGMGVLYYVSTAAFVQSLGDEIFLESLAVFRRRVPWEAQ